MNDIRCKTCRFWGTPAEAGGSSRTCRKIDHGVVRAYGDPAYVRSQHDHYASFVTRSDFGCVLYQEHQKEAS